MRLVVETILGLGYFVHIFTCSGEQKGVWFSSTVAEVYSITRLLAVQGVEYTLEFALGAVS